LKTVITDKYWSRKISLVTDVIIPYQWEALNDRVDGAARSGCVSNFEIAAGLKDGEFYGYVFQDSDLAKWIEAAAYALSVPGAASRGLGEKIDFIVALIKKAQWDDGYINTCTTLTGRENRWKNLFERHELYIAGHLMEAAAAYAEASGKTEFLDVMRKFADLICDTFGPNENQMHGYPGHQEIELALVKMYRVTGEKKYLETAKYFIDARGVGENYFELEARDPGYPAAWGAPKDPTANQSHAPVREQKTAEGHAVRALYMYSAMADIAKETGDTTLLTACETLWNNITERRMYITGGVGSTANGERFTFDYDLPNDSAYAESCASIALFMFGWRMNALTRDAKYIEAAETALYNTVSAGMAADGKSFFYVNPLEVVPEYCAPHTSLGHVKTVRQKWFGCACCPPNIARMIASLGKYIYSYEHNTLYVNLFIANEAETDGLKLKLTSGAPQDGFTLELEKETADELTLALRVPEYAEGYRVIFNGSEAAYQIKNGYAILSVTGRGAFLIDVRYGAPARYVYSNPAVSRNNGLAAVKKGPFVYCFEETDNGKGTASFFADAEREISSVWDEEQNVWKIKIYGKYLDGSDGKLYSRVKPSGRGAELTGVPYAIWGNRGEGEMFVWVRYLT